jgi:protein involved in polysaccharide export with SLBB domain
MLRRSLLLALTAVTLFASQAHAQGQTGSPAQKLASPYRISRGDRVSVSVLGESDLKVAGARVEPVGTINLVLIKEVRLAGLTIPEAEAAVAKAYQDGKFLRNPRVNITVDEYTPRTVIVSGKVNIQGRQDLPPNAEFTIKDLIFKAGGFTDTARSSAVKVTRTLPDGTQQFFILDVESGIKGRTNANTKDANFVLEPDDMVYVPEKII